jgi:hypothetical protein
LINSRRFQNINFYSNKHSSQPLALLLPLVLQVHLHSELLVPQHSALLRLVQHQSPQAVDSALALQAPLAHSELPQHLRSVHHLPLHLEQLHHPLEALQQALVNQLPLLAPLLPPQPQRLAKPALSELPSLLQQDLVHLQVRVHLEHQLHLLVVVLVLLLGVKLKKQTHPVRVPEVQCTTTLFRACPNTLKRV